MTEPERTGGGVSDEEEELRLVLIGRTGSGKSASGNTILGRRHFLSELRASSVTRVCEQGIIQLCEEEEEDEDSSRRKKRRRRRKVVVMDMPGFGDTRLDSAVLDAEIAKCVTLSSPGPHAFLLVVPLGRYTEDEDRAAGQALRVFGSEALQNHTLVLFTRGDDLEEAGGLEEASGGGRMEEASGGEKMEEFLAREDTPEKLRALLRACGGRYHVLNNKQPTNRKQVKMLLQKVEEMVEQNDGRCYTSTMFQQAELVIREEERLIRERAEEEERRSRGLALAKRRKVEMESERRSSGRRQALRLAVSRFRREAVLSQKVLDQVKLLVTAGATGMVVGAVFGAAAPLAVAAGASVVGNSAGLVGVSVAGGGVSKALGAMVAAAASKTAVTVGAAAGGVVGGSVGALAGAGASGPGEAALEALGQVGTVGAAVVGVAAGMGGALGAGAVMGALVEGGVALTAGEAAAGGVASIANATVVAAPEVVGGAVQAVGGVLAAPQAVGGAAQVVGGAAQAVGGVLAAPQVVGGAVQAVGGATQVVGGATSGSAVSSGLTGALNTVGTAARVVTVVTEVGRVVTGLLLAGGLVVKVMKEKVRSAAGNTERHSYEIYWNK